MNTSKSACKTLVLDAGPLLSLSPLRGLAERFLTVPQVLSELKDKNAREHFERLGMSAGVNIEVKEPDALSLARGKPNHIRTSQRSLCMLMDCEVNSNSNGQKDRRLFRSFARRSMCSCVDSCTRCAREG